MLPHIDHPSPFSRSPLLQKDVASLKEKLTRAKAAAEGAEAARAAAQESRQAAEVAGAQLAAVQEQLGGAHAVAARHAEEKKAWEVRRGEAGRGTVLALPWCMRAASRVFQASVPLSR